MSLSLEGERRWNNPLRVIERIVRKRIFGGQADAFPGALRLDRFLEEVVFEGNAGVEVMPDPRDVAGFAQFMTQYKACLPVERAAVECK